MTKINEASDLTSSECTAVEADLVKETIKDKIPCVIKAECYTIACWLERCLQTTRSFQHTIDE